MKKNIWANLQRIIALFTQKLLLSCQNYGVGIRDPKKTYPGKQTSPKTAIPQPAIANQQLYYVCQSQITNPQIFVINPLIADFHRILHNFVSQP